MEEQLLEFIFGGNRRILWIMSRKPWSNPLSKKAENLTDVSPSYCIHISTKTRYELVRKSELSFIHIKSGHASLEVQPQ